MATRVLVVAVLLTGVATGAQRPAPSTLIAEFRDRIETAGEVPWLERLASSHEFLLAEWQKAGISAAALNRVYRSLAYVRLGLIGTPESRAAIGRVEAALRGRSVLSEPIEAGARWMTPTPGMSDAVLTPRSTRVLGPRRYAVVVLQAYGPFAPFLMWQDVESPGRWSRPRLAGAPARGAWLFEPALSEGPLGLRVTYEPRPGDTSGIEPPPSVDIDVADVERDSDNDGWTDLEERQLGLDPRHADSDRDGQRDDVDAAPLFGRAPAVSDDEETQIVRRAVLVTFGLTGSRWAVFVRPGVLPLQVEGLSGPMLFGVDLPTRDGLLLRDPRSLDTAPLRGGAQTTWTVARAGDRATVNFTHWSGSSFQSMSRVQLGRVDREWVVVASQLVGSR